MAEKDVVTMEACYNEQKRFVTNKIFIWALGVILTVVGWQFKVITDMNNRIELISLDNNRVTVQLSQIQTDLQWIKAELKTINK